MSAMVVRDAPAELPWKMLPSKLCVVAAVTKRLVPYLIEATLIPTLLFYGFLLTLDLTWAFVAALGWSYTAVGRRIVGRRPVPALLIFACFGITIRTSIYLCSGNTFVYFVQPIVRTLATAAMFAVSVLIGRPAHRPIRHRLLPAQRRGPGPAGRRATVPAAHLPVGGRERRGRGA